MAVSLSFLNQPHSHPPNLPFTSPAVLHALPVYPEQTLLPYRPTRDLCSTLFTCSPLFHRHLDLLAVIMWLRDLDFRCLAIICGFATVLILLLLPLASSSFVARRDGTYLVR